MSIEDTYNQLHNALLDALKEIPTFLNEKDSWVGAYCATYKQFCDKIKTLCARNEKLKEVLPYSQKLAEKVNDSVKEFLNGNVSLAYRSMSLWWSRSSNTNKDILGKYGRIYTTNKDTKYYRARTFETSNIVDYKQMFCVPFKYRRDIKNERYSVSGFPCLYAACSVYTCWEELNRPSLDKLRVSRISILSDMNLLDLRHNQPCSNIKDLQYYLVMIPLIIACSFPVSQDNKNKPFKLEYFFPQLLMNAVTTGKLIRGITIDGIIYTSVACSCDHILIDNSNNDCIAIPKVDKNNKKLTKDTIDEDKVEKSFNSHFNITNPVCYEYEIIRNWSLSAISNLTKCGINNVFDMLESRLAQEDLHKL